MTLEPVDLPNLDLQATRLVKLFKHALEYDPAGTLTPYIRDTGFPVGHAIYAPMQVFVHGAVGSWARTTVGGVLISGAIFL